MDCSGCAPCPGPPEQPLPLGDPCSSFEVLAAGFSWGTMFHSLRSSELSWLNLSSWLFTSGYFWIFFSVLQFNIYQKPPLILLCLKARVFRHLFLLSPVELRCCVCKPITCWLCMCYLIRCRIFITSPVLPQ